MPDEQQRSRAPRSRPAPATAAGRRSQSMITAASIISRSASGSAILAELRLDVPAPRQPAVDLVGDPRDAEHDPRRPDRGRRRTRDRARRTRGTSTKRAIVIAFGSLSGSGRAPWRHDQDTGGAGQTLALPGFVDAHSHAFQRALRGRAEGGDFWAWRDVMLAAAERQTPDTVRASIRRDYTEMRAAGYTAVGEFHYLGFEEALAAADAAHEASIELTLLLSRATRAAASPASARVAGRLPGAGRGAARPRACGRRRPPLRPRLPCRTGSRRSAATPRPRACRCTSTPTSSRARSRSASPSTASGRSSCSRATGCLGPHTTVVHATHASDAELDLLADAGARVCVCPTTEANLGDGFVPVAALCERGIGICIGSDSNVRIDPLEELRELEGTARRRGQAQRDLASTRCSASARTRAPLRSGSRRGRTSSSTSTSRRSAGSPKPTSEALVFGCAADVSLRKNVRPSRAFVRGTRAGRPGRAAHRRRRRIVAWPRRRPACCARARSASPRATRCSS